MLYILTNFTYKCGRFLRITRFIIMLILVLHHCYSWISIFSITPIADFKFYQSIFDQLRFGQFFVFSLKVRLFELIATGKKYCIIIFLTTYNSSSHSLLAWQCKCTKHTPRSGVPLSYLISVKKWKVLIKISMHYVYPKDLFDFKYFTLETRWWLHGIN